MAKGVGQDATHLRNTLRESIQILLEEIDQFRLVLAFVIEHGRDTTHVHLSCYSNLIGRKPTEATADYAPENGMQFQCRNFECR